MGLASHSRNELESADYGLCFVGLGQAEGAGGMEEGWRRDGGGQKGQERQERQGGGRMSVKCSLFGRARETLPIGAWGPASLPPSTNDLPYRAEEYERVVPSPKDLQR